MADLYLRAPDGSIGVFDESDAQAAADAGYTSLSPEEVEAAQQREVAGMGDRAAAYSGLTEAPDDYSVPQAFAEKALSAATFGQAPGLDLPEVVAAGRRFTTERPITAMGAEALGSLPLAIGGAYAGAAAGAAVKGAGLLARGAVAAGDVTANALVGGAQVEGEETRLSGEDFSFTDAAITGAVGEALGRGAAWGIARSVGGARNLLARAERDLVATDAAESLSKGGWVRDYQTAQHAETYHNELADLAARDLDTLESAFGEVSRQDRKRSRIIRTVQDNPAAQREVNIQAAEHLRTLRAALADELAEGTGPAKKLARQLDERIAVLDEAPFGKKLWRVMDENRQALQEYRQDLYQAYETNPGSAWLSREGLQAIDAAEKSTREALLREDVWGVAAAQAQREYNEPFHGKWFPSRKTVVSKLHFEQMKNAEGFAVYRGDPTAVRKFLARDLSEPDGARLAEQFSQYLDGAEAIARAGAKDSPKASRDALEAIRRLRKAQANAAQVTAAAARTARRTTGINQAGMAVGAATGLAAAGPGGAALGALAARGARIGDWLSRAGTKLGWGAGKPLDMAALLGKDALPDAPAADLSSRLTDDILDSPFKPAPDLPVAPTQGAIRPNEIRRVGVMNPTPPADRAGVGPVRLDPRGQAAQPRGVDAIQPQGQRAVGEAEEYVDVEPEPGGGTIPPPSFERSGARTPVDDLDGPDGTPIDSLAPPEPSARPSLGRVNANEEYEAAMAPWRGKQSADAARAEALSKEEFDDLVENLRSVDAKNEEGVLLSDLLEGSEDELVNEGFIDVDAVLRPYESPIGRAMREEAAARGAAKTGPPADLVAEAKAVEAIQGLHPRAQVKYPDRLGGDIQKVFGTAPTAQQWQKLMPLDSLQKLGRLGDGTGQPNPMVLERMKAHSTPEQVQKYIDEATNGKVVIQSFDGQVSISAYGPLGPAAPFERMLPDGTLEPDPGGLFDYTWKISRSFKKDETTGELQVFHDFFFVRDDLQATGVGLEVLKSQFGEYARMGVKDVGVDAAEVGKYFWPSIGFNRPEVVPAAVKAYETFLVRNGLADEAAAKAATKNIKSLPSLANAEHGKQFFLQVDGNWNADLHVKLDESDPLYHLMRKRLGLGESALLAGMAFAGWMEGSPENENEQGVAAAAATPLGLFAARAAMFRNVRARVVAQAARRLFSATADALPRVTARLVYSRTQIEERQREFQTWQANPQELVDRVAEGFRDVPPEHSGTVAGGVFRTATFLKEKLPSVTKTNAMSMRQIPVSAEAMAKYARYEQAALNPREAIQEAAESRHISTELLETLQELYPDLLAELRVQAYLEVREAGPPTTIQARANYAQLFDGDGSVADPAFSMDVARMTAYAYEQSVPTKPPAPSGAPGVSQMATVVAAPRPGVV